MDYSLDLGHMYADAQHKWNGSMFIEIVIIGAWNVWKIRNQKVFEQVTPSHMSWKELMKLDLRPLKYRVRTEHHEALSTICDRLS